MDTGGKVFLVGKGVAVSEGIGDSVWEVGTSTVDE